MTKRRPSNKKPTGLNRSLGNSLLNEKERSRRSHQRAKFDGDIENPAFLEKDEKKVIDSVTEESGLEEFLAKAELAGTEFTADRESLRIVESNSAVVIPSKKDFLNNLELQKEYESRLRIPRRPSKELWNDVEELNRLENEVFLKWREDLADLQEVDGLALTPFERNPEMWKELWRVVERSDIVVQIVDARNPLLFRSKDLENYVKEVDPAKQNLLLVNKSDLLEPDHLVQWESYFKQEGVEVIFWSAVEELEKIAEDEDGTTDEPEPSCSHEISAKFKVIRQKEELIRYVKQIGGIKGIPGEKQLVVGMVGYPNVGKSSTINKLVGAKKVSVSATPGKTRHFQTIHIDKELCLCDCPGLVMPSFTFGRNEMFLNGIMPVDQMREHFGPTALLLSRIPTSYIEEQYSVMLPDRESPSAVDLLTTLAFMRGFMSSAGIPDCSRAARMLIKDVVTGKIMWVAAPPGTDQHTFDHVLYHTEDQGKKSGGVQLKQLEKRGLLEGDSALNSKVDSLFFDGRLAGAHVRTAKTGANTDANASVATSCIPLIEETKGSKKHFNGRKKEKLRRIYVGSYA